MGEAHESCLLISLLLPALAFAQTANDRISQADSLIGTKTSSQHDNGETIPGAVSAPEKQYVKSIVLDGTPVRNWWIDWDHLAKADKLVFTLAGTPNKDAGQAPPFYPALK